MHTITSNQIDSIEQLIPELDFSPKTNKSKPTYHSHCALQVYRISETKVGTDLKNPLHRVYIVGWKSATIPTWWDPPEAKREARKAATKRDPPLKLGEEKLQPP